MNEPLLEGARLSGRLEAGLLKACLTQTYTNPGTRDLEVVYTFPLPFYASITEVTATIGEKQLKGMVKAHRSAEQDYEAAISKGDSSILVESSGNGLFTANLGNLRPGERFTVSMHFVQIIDWHHDRARLLFPTTIAPRYGEAQAQGKLPFHADTGTSITAEYGFELDVLVRGSMASAVLESPSHSISQIPDEEGSVRIRLRDEAFLDRDFVLRLDGVVAPEGEVYVESGSDEHFAMATFYPSLKSQQAGQQVPDAERAGDPSSPWQYPLRVKLLVDSSGSMEGDSIESARKGIRALFDGLRSKDQIAVARFGSSLEHVLEKPKAADPKTSVILRQWLTTLEANLGGTELESALVGVFKSTGDQEPFDVLLITDGEVWDISATVESAKSSGHRIFAIGVGSSPGESLLRQLAEQTGGAALFVNPNEDMTEAMHRLVSMMSGPRVSSVKVTWNSEPALEALVSEHLYVGVPFRAVAMFKGPMDTEKQPAATLHYRIGEDSHVLSSSSTASVRNDLAVRYVVAEACLQCMDDEARAAFAEAHQLVCLETAWILVLERDDDDKAEPLPGLAQVPSMHAAGSHGFGKLQIFKQVADNGVSYGASFMASALAQADLPNDVSLTRNLNAMSASRMLKVKMEASSALESIEERTAQNLEIPAFLRRTSRGDLETVAKQCSRLFNVANEVFEGSMRFKKMLDDQMHVLESVRLHISGMPKPDSDAFLDVWAEVTGGSRERLEQSDGPLRTIERGMERLEKSREYLFQQLEIFDRLREIAANSDRVAWEKASEQQDRITSSESGQGVILTELLSRLNSEDDLEVLWDWALSLTLPGLMVDQLKVLHKAQSLSKPQVIAIFALMLIDDEIEPQPNRQQMRLLNYAIRDLDELQVELFKQMLWDSADMATG